MNRLGVTSVLATTALVCGLASTSAQATVLGAETATTSGSTYRLAGPDRYQTAVEISQRWFTGGSTAAPKAIYIASGESYPDALSAAPVAALQKSPLLLVPSSAIPKSVSTEIIRLGSPHIIVIGGAGAVSDSVVSKFESMGKNVTRIGGSDRYDTSRKVVNYAIDQGVFGNGTTNVFIATGRDFPDALSASGVAGLASVAAPVLLEDGTNPAMSAGGQALLARLPGAAKVTAIGGTGAVSSGLYQSIPNAKQRVSGSDRYQTSQAIVDTFRTGQSVAGSGAKQGVFATGMNFPDALAGAAYAGATGSTLWVTPPNCVPQPVLNSAGALQINSYALLGGTGALSGAVDSLTSCDSIRVAPAPAPAASSAPTTPTTGGVDPALQQVVDLTNAERAKVGCPAVHVDARLQAAAQLHTEDMFKNNYLDHYSKDGRSPWDRIKAQGYTQGSSENVAMGFQTAAQVMQGWMNSPGHKANLLACDARAIGVGHAGNYWTQDFGRV